MTTHDGHYEVYWPRSPRQTGIQPLAKRLDTLNGKVIAQVWDFLFRGDAVFEHLETAIKKQYPDVKFVSWREFGSSHGGEEKRRLPSSRKSSKPWG